MTLTDLRAEIDDLDDQLIALLARRQRLVEQAAAHKRDEREVRAEDRRQAVMRRVRQQAEAAGLAPAVAEAVWEAMVRAFIALELETHRRQD